MIVFVVALVMVWRFCFVFGLNDKGLTDFVDIAPHGLEVEIIVKDYHYSPFKIIIIIFVIIIMIIVGILTIMLDIITIINMTGMMMSITTVGQYQSYDSIHELIDPMPPSASFSTLSNPFPRIHYLHPCHLIPPPFLRIHSFHLRHLRLRYWVISDCRV